VVATIKTVADATGLSISTVSRALAEKGRVSAGTRQLIVRAAKDLGYRPNQAAKTLVTGHTNTIGLVVPDIANPFFTSLLKGVQSRARSRGYIVLLADADNDANLERDVVREISHLTAGLIIHPVAAATTEGDLAIYAADGHAVVVNREADGIASARADLALGLRQAVAHLVALGHRSIGYLSGSEFSWANRYRLEVLKADASQYGIEVTEFGPYSTTAEGGAAALEPVVASRVTAAIAFNDEMALGLMSQMRARGMTCPTDLSIIGGSDFPYASMISPALTTIRVESNRIGRAAVDLLVELIENDEAEPGQRVALPTGLVVRESTGIAASRR